MAVGRAGLLLMICVISLMSGCAHQTRNGIIRVWADYNSYKRPSAYYEQLSHWPLKRKRVALNRWRYNKPEEIAANYVREEEPAAYASVSSSMSDQSEMNHNGENGTSDSMNPSLTPVPPVPEPQEALPPEPEDTPAAPITPKKQQGPTASENRIQLGSYQTFSEESKPSNPVSLQPPVAIPAGMNDDIRLQRDSLLWSR